MMPSDQWLKFINVISVIAYINSLVSVFVQMVRSGQLILVMILQAWNTSCYLWVSYFACSPQKTKRGIISSVLCKYYCDPWTVCGGYVSMVLTLLHRDDELGLYKIGGVSALISKMLAIFTASHTQWGFYWRHINYLWTYISILRCLTSYNY